MKIFQLKKIWNQMTDFEQWPSWHPGIESCKLHGDFEVGRHFTLTLKGGKEFKITLTEIDPGKSFTDCTQFPGAKMYDTHTIQETENGVIISNKIVVTGFLKWLWIKLVAKKVADSIETKIDTLIHLAKQDS